jgi:uncharacterized membrane protein
MQDEERSARVEARREAAPLAVLAAALLLLLALVSWVEDWDFLGLPWWTWAVLAVPASLVAADVWLGTRRGRRAALALLGVVFAGNLAGLAVLVAALVRARGDDLGGGQLLFTAAAIWLTNVVVFGLCFWELDRGGPVARAQSSREPPDFRFPQDESSGDDADGWRPAVWDYLYISLTNSTAFSPTDALPLTHRAKLLMGVEGVLSLILVVLVTARAVNVLGV